MGDTVKQGLIHGEIPIDGDWVSTDLCRPDAAAGLVIFAHGRGSSRLSPRNRAIARTLQEPALPLP